MSSDPTDENPHERWKARSVLLLGVAVGAAVGIGGWALLTAQRVALDRIVFMGRHALWMKPLVEIALCLGVGAIALAAARARGGRDPLPIAAFGYGFLAGGSILFLVPSLHPVARLVLAAGCGAVAARVAPRLGAGHERLAARWGWALGAVVLVLTAVSLVLPGLRERRIHAALPEAGEGAPNVLLIILDTVRASSLDVYGNPRPTSPVLREVAAEGVRFDRAVAPAPWTLPSHASMFTGRMPHDLSADWRVPLDGAHPTLAERLAEAGYATAGFVANMGYCGWETGLQRGFQRYEDHPVSLRQLIASSPLLEWIATHPRVRAWIGSDENLVRKHASDVRRDFLSWLDGRREGPPFFAFLNYYDAHAPYMPPEPYRSEFAIGPPRGDLSPLHRWNSDPFGPLPEAAVLAQERAAYEASIAALDADLGRLIAALEERGLSDNTLLVVASDHGEEFGERGVYDHGNSLYEEGLRVPLLLRWPGHLPAGRVIGTPVSLARLAATVLDLIGLPDDGVFGGGSMARLWQSEGEDAFPEQVLSEVSHAPRLPDWFPVSRGDMASLMGRRWHYIRNGDGTEELYDLTAGSGSGDLAVGHGTDGEAGDALRALRAELEGRRPGDSRPAAADEGAR